MKVSVYYEQHITRLYRVELEMPEMTEPGMDELEDELTRLADKKMAESPHMIEYTDYAEDGPSLQSWGNSKQ